MSLLVLIIMCIFTTVVLVLLYKASKFINSVQQHNRLMMKHLEKQDPKPKEGEDNPNPPSETPPPE